MPRLYNFYSIYLLDDKDIPRDTEKGKFLPLEGKNGQNSRIGLFEQKLIENNKETKIIEYFRAIKFIGNEGSHAGEITKTDVLDAYEILELILEDLYIQKRQKVEQKISKIISTKQPLSKLKNIDNDDE